MDLIGHTANSLPAAAVAEDTIMVVIVAAIAAAIIYLVASFAIARARSRDDRRSSDRQSR